MKTKFEEIIEDVLKHEGGYVNDPHDRGGETNFGIGIDHYETIGNTSIDFADILSYNYEQEMTVGKFNVSHVFGNFYLQGNFNTENYNSIELGYNIQF